MSAAPGRRVYPFRGIVEGTAVFLLGGRWGPLDLVVRHRAVRGLGRRGRGCRRSVQRSKHGGLSVGCDVEYALRVSDIVGVGEETLFKFGDAVQSIGCVGDIEVMAAGAVNPKEFAGRGGGVPEGLCQDFLKRGALQVVGETVVPSASEEALWWIFFMHPVGGWPGVEHSFHPGGGGFYWDFACFFEHVRPFDLTGRELEAGEGSGDAAKDCSSRVLGDETLPQASVDVLLEVFGACF